MTIFERVGRASTSIHGGGVMVLLDVTIPAGVVPGDDLRVNIPSGEELVVMIPKGFAAGDVLSVECDLEDRSTSTRACPVPTSEEVSVIVPDDVYEGESFACEIANGEVFDIIVPPGCGPGDTIFCQVPTVGECGGSLQGSRRPSTEDSSSSSDASSDHMYRCGQRVMVQRTDGSYSKATILSSFEGVFDVLYEVRLESGLCKQAVPECEMYDAAKCDDPNFGRHLTDAFAALMDGEPGTLENLLCHGQDYDPMWAYMEANWGMCE